MLNQVIFFSDICDWLFNLNLVLCDLHQNYFFFYFSLDLLPTQSCYKVNIIHPQSEFLLLFFSFLIRLPVKCPKNTASCSWSYVQSIQSFTIKYDLTYKSIIPVFHQVEEVTFYCYFAESFYCLCLILPHAFLTPLEKKSHFSLLF